MTLQPLPDLNKIQKVVIIRLSSIGDVVHALPVSSALKQSYPHLELTWIVEDMSADVVLGNPFLSDVIVIPRARWKSGRTSSLFVWREYINFLADLRRRKFDLSIDLHGRAKSGVIAAAGGAPYRVGWKRLREGSQLISHETGANLAGKHRVEWYLNVVKALGAETAKVDFPLVIAPAAIEEAGRLLEQYNIPNTAGIAIINPAAGDQERRWSAEGYAQLIERLFNRWGLISILIGSKKDVELCERILNRVQFLHNLSVNDSAAVQPCINLAGKTDLKTLAALIDRSRVQICSDTGSAHIGAALGRPTVALFGRTDPAHAGPWGQEELTISRWQMCSTSCDRIDCPYGGSVGSRVVRHENSEISDGSSEIQSNAPTSACMRAISVDEIEERVNMVMKGPYAPQ